MLNYRICNTIQFTSMVLLEPVRTDRTSDKIGIILTKDHCLFPYCLPCTVTLPRSTRRTPTCNNVDGPVGRSTVQDFLHWSILGSGVRLEGIHVGKPCGNVHSSPGLSGAYRRNKRLVQVQQWHDDDQNIIVTKCHSLWTEHYESARVQSSSAQVWPT